MTVYNKRRETREVTIRLAKPEDVPDIITLIIKQHGNYYPYADLYSMDFVRRVIENRDMYIVVAELAGGLLAGMTGANSKTQFAGTLEWIMLTIRPSCRGFGMGKILISFLQQALPAEQYADIYGHCMSLDTASQGILAGLGHHITGTLLNCYRLDTHAENFAGLALPFKHNLIVTCLPGNKKDAGILYIPPVHAGYIKGVYESLGTAYTFREPERAEPGGAPSDCTVTPMEEHQYCELRTEEIGSDFEKTLDDVLKQYGAREGQSFNAFINLNDPAAPWAYRLLEDRGFSFAGIHALSGPREYMMLHYSPAIPVPFDRIMVLPGFAGEFAYIREQYERRKR
ncbi:MAG: GNAT family N-acetyltransferase [Spirochaetaceae bacterium]|jgi:ribosomal protein S18 acetylase RimI-like enzyme|nr:GNAT family N-acetyltransferase [Spirochaetaceae bacterium]